MTPKEASLLQEKQIAKFLGGTVQSNSGGTAFGGGDVHTKSFFIEAKTTTKDSIQFTIKKEWLEKMKEQEFEQGKEYSALAFRFQPDVDEDYFIIDKHLFKILKQYLEEEEK